MSLAHPVSPAPNLGRRAGCFILSILLFVLSFSLTACGRMQSAAPDDG